MVLPTLLRTARTLLVGPALVGLASGSTAQPAPSPPGSIGHPVERTAHLLPPPELELEPPPAPGLAGDQFGTSVARLTAPDPRSPVGRYLVGNYWAESGGTNTGAVYVVDVLPDLTTSLVSTIANNSGGFHGPLKYGDFFGWSVTSLGDLDRDGTLEVCIGAPWHQWGPWYVGAVWIVSLDDAGRVVDESLISEQTMPGLLWPFGRRFGSALACMSRVDPDQRGARLLVGAPSSNHTSVEAGRIYVLDIDGQKHVSVVDGIGDGLGLTPYENFGAALATCLLPTGDTALAVGSPSWLADGTGPGTLPGDGAVRVLVAPGTGTPTFRIAAQLDVRRSQVLAAAISGEPAVTQFGAAVAWIADRNGDGVPELAVGCPNDEYAVRPAGASIFGSVWLFPSTFRGIDPEPTMIGFGAGGLASVPHVNDSLGRSLAADVPVTIGPLTTTMPGTDLLVGHLDTAGSKTGGVFVLTIGEDW